MYHDKIYVPQAIFDIMSDKEASEGEEGVMKTPCGLFAKLYVLAEKYQIPRLRNDAIDSILYLWDDYKIDICVASYIYRNTTLEESPLRRLLVRLAMYQDGHDDELRKARDSGTNCHEFFFDMVLEMGKAKMNGERGQVVEGGKVFAITDPMNKDKYCEEFHIHDRSNNRPCRKIKRFYEEDLSS